jgi:hypothetical protein
MWAADYIISLFDYMQLIFVIYSTRTLPNVIFFTMDISAPRMYVAGEGQILTVSLNCTTAVMGSRNVISNLIK